jgi:predicted ArsR family transcriptional regulator
LQGQCRAIKANGERRKGTATGPNGYCWAHDPKNAEHRRRTASKAGRSKPGREVKDLKKQLEDLAADVLSGRVDRGNAVAVNQIINTRARRMELERKIKETEELEERLEALEQIQEQKGGGRRWHA